MFKQLLLTIGLGLLISSCGTNPYKESNKVYEQQLKVLQQKLAEKEAIALKKVETTTTSHDTLYTKQINTLKDSISKFNPSKSILPTSSFARCLDKMEA